MFTDEMKLAISNLQNLIEKEEGLSPCSVVILRFQIERWLNEIEQTEVFAPRKILAFPPARPVILPFKNSDDDK
jgi:hypothetical protein